MKNVSEKRYNEARAKALELMASLSVTEKIGQLSQFGTSIYNNELNYHAENFPEGKIGSYLSIKKPETINFLQKECKDKFPTYIPFLFADDVIHGFRTTLPTPLAQSCSWNPDAAEKGAAVAAKEAWLAGIRWTFSPMVDIARDPRWGRIMEGYGEDPYLCGKMGAATVRGYQGKEIGEKYKLLACMKHFIGYGNCVGGRDYNEVEMSLPTLYDIYLPSFKEGIDAGAATVMSAFNSLNGVPCTGNKWLLQDILRDKVGFEGFVVSDWGSVHEQVPHGVAKDTKEAMERGFKSGVNMLMSGDDYSNYLPELIAEGKITEADIDEMLLPILTYKYLLNLWEDPFANAEEAEKTFFCDEHMEICREIGRECIVLAENNGILPLDKSKKIAVIGPLADDKKEIMGSWTCWADENYSTSIFEGLKKAGYDVRTERACGVYEGDDADIDRAVELAKNCDITVLCLGEEAGMAGECQSRVNNSFTTVQWKLMNKIIDLGKPIVLLISSGRPMLVDGFREKMDAIAYIWQLGNATGDAVADVLSGEYDASGRLSVSVLKDVRQAPLYYNRPNCGRPYTPDNGYHMGYRDIAPLPEYPFGYGLSYAKFEYSNVTLSADTLTPDGNLTAKCTVKNVSNREGSTVAQLYIRDMVGSTVRPIKQLKGFQKFALKAGEEREISFTLSVKDLAFHNPQLRYVAEAGDFTLWIGQHSDDDSRPATFALSETCEVDYR